MTEEYASKANRRRDGEVVSTTLLEIFSFDSVDVHPPGPSRGHLQVPLSLDGPVTVGISAAVGRPGPRTGPVRVTVARDQGIHAAGPVDRYTLPPSPKSQAAASGTAAVCQRRPRVLCGTHLRVRLSFSRATAQEQRCHHALGTKRVLWGLCYVGTIAGLRSSELGSVWNLYYVGFWIYGAPVRTVGPLLDFQQVNFGVSVLCTMHNFGTLIGNIAGSPISGL